MTSKIKLINDVAKLQKIPTLVYMQIGNEKVFDSYLKNIRKECKDIGVDIVHFKFDPIKYPLDKLCEIIKAFSNDELVDGIFVQSPFPKGYDYNKLSMYISSKKEVNGLKKDSSFYKVNDDLNMFASRLTLLENVVKAYKFREVI